jgi:hypothetical protein
MKEAEGGGRGVWGSDRREEGGRAEGDKEREKGEGQNGTHC